MPQLRSARLLSVLVLSFVLFGASDALALPDLEPYGGFAGWDGPVVVSTVPGTNTSAGTFSTSETLYVDWAVANFGDTAATNVEFTLRVDGIDVFTWTSDSLGSFFAVPIQDFQITGLSGGLHDIQIVADPSNTIAESNELNNIFTKTVTLTEPGDPEIRIDPVDVAFASATSPSVKTFGTTDYAASGLVGRDESEALLARASETGSVRVIARLDAGFLPEGLLATNGVGEQRERIAARQDLVVATLGMPERAVKRFATIPFLALEVTREQLARLKTTPGVLEIVEDPLASPTMSSSNPRIGSPVAWAEGFTGAGQAVAVLDTGVDKAHPFFSTGSNKVVSEACYSTTSANSTSVCPGGVAASTAAGSGEDCAPTTTGCSHGTHVAGTVAGNDGVGPHFGVARDANIIAMQVFSQFTGTSCTNSGLTSPCALSFGSDQILALERVLALSNSMDIAAVNMSLGGGQFFSQATCDASNTAIKAAIDNLRAAGIATVIASGNNGFLDSMGSPGCVSTAVSVGATTDFDAVASFSNIAPFVSLVAPGTAIVSAFPGGGLATSQGTSMATPHVAGAWAVVKEAMPAATVPEVLQLLRDTARQRADLRAGGSATGLRRIDIGEAILTATHDGFTIFNEGTANLDVSGVTPATSAPWIATLPTTPFTVLPGASRHVSVEIDLGQAPAGLTTTRLNVTSNDADESPYPDAVDITVDNDIVVLAAPTNVVATATSPTSIGIAWSAVVGADSYRVYRSANRINYSLVGSPTGTSLTDSMALAANTAYVYKVRAFAGSESPDSNLDVATTALITTDAIITADVTTVKAAHWTELLPVVNSFRTLAGLGAMSFTVPPVGGGSILRQTVIDLRTGLDQARAIIGVPAASYADPSLAVGNVIEAQHLIDLRNFGK